MPSPIAVSIELADGEREQLVSWSRRHTSAQALALRSVISNPQAAPALEEHGTKSHDKGRVASAALVDASRSAALLVLGSRHLPAGG